MPSFQSIVASVSSVLFVIASSFGEAPARVRGTITAIHDHTLMVKQRDGRTYSLTTGPNTTYANVVPSSLDAIKVNDYVGSAVKGSMDGLVAVEIAIIPENMRAGRISYYAWDPLPDFPAKSTHSTTAPSMTNGVLPNVSSAVPQLVDTNMTNGIVTAEKSDAGGRTLTVTYASRTKSFRMTVPPDAPVVRYILADRSAMFIGSTVMIKTNPGDQADLVTIGKGVTPPM
jgi:hypothetical protein